MGWVFGQARRAKTVGDRRGSMPDEQGSNEHGGKPIGEGPGLKLLIWPCCSAQFNQHRFEPCCRSVKACVGARGNANLSDEGLGCFGTPLEGSQNV